MSSRRSKRSRPRAEQLLGSLEAACMTSLWRRSPATVGDVLKAINVDHDPELAYTTVMTVLSRLHEKGYVRRRRVGRGYEYEPEYSEDELVELIGRREVSEIVDRYGRVALAHFAETLRETDPDLLRDLEALREEGGGA